MASCSEDARSKDFPPEPCSVARDRLVASYRTEHLEATSVGASQDHPRRKIGKLRGLILEKATTVSRCGGGGRCRMWFSFTMKS